MPVRVARALEVRRRIERKRVMRLKARGQDRQRRRMVGAPVGLVEVCAQHARVAAVCLQWRGTGSAAGSFSGNNRPRDGTRSNRRSGSQRVQN